MNLANLDDKTRIKILKVLVVTYMAGLLLNLYYLEKTVDNIVELSKKHNTNVRKMRVAAKIIDRLMKDADPALIQEIVRDFEFDWIVAEIDPDEIDPKD